MATLKDYCAIALAAFVLTSCAKESQDRQERIIPVLVAQAVKKDVPVVLQAVGNVEAVTTITVKARLGGELKKVYCAEGEYVTKGELLFIIDPRPYEAELKQAEATLAQDRVRLENAERDARRYAELVDQGVVTEELYDKVRTTADALSAAVKADMASVENAALQVGYCSIRSPISGRTGKLMIHQGNMIKANDETPLIIISQINPIYVSFSVPEKNLLEIKQFQSTQRLQVRAFIPQSIRPPEEGVLTFIDTAVDTVTGTILLKALFDNAEKVLWPGQFVNVSLTVAEQSGVTVVPSQAVQAGQAGSYTFVVKNDNTVEMRAVTAGRENNGETVISSGLQPGELVVVDGQLQLSTGTKVAIKNTGSIGRTDT